MEVDPNSAVQLIISGRVQGVWFRNWTVGEAKARGLDGWVRNRRDGTVEALLSGPSAMVGEMIAACHQGPPLARVRDVEAQPATALAPGSGFKQRGAE